MIGVPNEESGEEVKALIKLSAALNVDPQMQALAAKAGFELVNVGTEGMDAFIREMSCICTDMVKQIRQGKQSAPPAAAAGPPLTVSTTTVSPLCTVSTAGRFGLNWPQWHVSTQAGRRWVVMARLVQQ